MRWKRLQRSVAGTVASSRSGSRRLQTAGRLVLEFRLRSHSSLRLLPPAHSAPLPFLGELPPSLPCPHPGPGSRPGLLAFNPISASRHSSLRFLLYRLLLALDPETGVRADPSETRSRQPGDRSERLNRWPATATLMFSLTESSGKSWGQGSWKTVGPTWHPLSSLPLQDRR